MLSITTDSKIYLEYLAEGAANVVYKIYQAPHSTNASTGLNFSNCAPHNAAPSEVPPLRTEPRLDGRLVRLRKDLPSTVPVLDSQKHFENLIRPLFRPENLVEQTLFQPSPDLIKYCNATLRQMEKRGTRPAKRHGAYLVADEAYGTLITDMSSNHNDDNDSSSLGPSSSAFTYLEFKPKWLVQSPSAPKGSKRCRTCALRAMKRAGRDDADFAKGFCPLDLVSSDKSRLAKVVDSVVGDKRNRANNVKHQLIAFLYKNPLLDRLRRLQAQMDPVGVLAAPELTAPKFLCAMTLRDCTLYLKVPADGVSGEGGIEARLGDLDLKTSGGMKGDYWRALERVLVENGWYAGTELGGVGVDNFCQLAGG